LGEIPDSDAISGSVNKRTPLPFYPETMKLPVRDAYMNIAKKLVKNLVYKKGRVPTIPSIPEQFANDVLARFSQEPLELNLE
jgi:hypothetical protein